MGSGTPTEVFLYKRNLNGMKGSRIETVFSNVTKALSELSVIECRYLKIDSRAANWVLETCRAGDRRQRVELGHCMSDRV